LSRQLASLGLGVSLSGSALIWTQRSLAGGIIWREIPRRERNYSSELAAFGQTQICKKSAAKVLLVGHPSAFIPSDLKRAKRTRANRGGDEKSLTQNTKSVPDSTIPRIISRLKIDLGLKATEKPAAVNAFLMSFPKNTDPGSLSKQTISMLPFGIPARSSTSA